MKQVMQPAQRGIVALRDRDHGVRRGEVRVGVPGFCSPSDHTQVHESPPAAQRTHHNNGAETQYGVSCTG